MRAPILALAGILMLAGCTATVPETPTGVEGIEEAIEQESGGQVDLDGDAELPADWPAELPVPEGELLTAVVIDGSHSLTIRVPSEAAAEGVVARIEALGFTDLGGMDTPEFVAHTLERDGWTVTIGWTVSDDEILLSYTSGPH